MSTGTRNSKMDTGTSGEWRRRGVLSIWNYDLGMQLSHVRLQRGLREVTEEQSTSRARMARGHHNPGWCQGQRPPGLGRGHGGRTEGLPR